VSSSSAGNDLNIELGSKTATVSATLKVSGIKVTTSSVQSSISAYPTLPGVTFTPSSVRVATVAPTPPTAPTMTLAGVSQPQVAPGESTGAAGTWTLTMTGDMTSGSGWTSGSALTVTVSPPSGTNCAGSGFLYFAGAPTATVSSATGTSTTPSVSASLASSGSCSASQPNVLKLSLDNSVYFNSTSQGTVKITISNIRYAVGSTAAADGTGSVLVTASFSPSASVATTNAANAKVEPGTTAPPTTTAQSTTPPQGSSPIEIKADTPPVSVLENAYDASISPVDLLESATTHVPVGYVCLTLSGAYFNTSTLPSVAVARGNGAASASGTFQGAGATGASTVEIQVTKASTTQGEYTVAGLAVDAGTRAGPVTVVATRGTSPSCALDSGAIGSTTAFTIVQTPVTRIYGPTPDATAAAELEHQFDAQGTSCPGRPGARPVVLATDAHFPDALASAYLASSLGTGELLTPTASLSTVTQNAIRDEGITQVFIVGGDLAVSNSVSQQLAAMLAYSCGGSAPLTSAGPVHIEVTRIAGETAYDTAEWVAQYPTAGTVGSLDVTGAYVGTNRAGGMGRYNDTAGIASTAPTTSSTLPTAIVATGRSFQDAESAGVLSYADHFPILLTTQTALSPQATSVISGLAIKQVIVMGGPLAVSDGVVSSLEALGVSVLRIAGQDATDTAVQLANFEMGSKAGHVGAGWAGSGSVTLARGNGFSDGLAGAIVAAGAGRTHSHGPEPILLCFDPTSAGSYLESFLAAAGRTGIDGNAADRPTSLIVFGGPQAVSQSVVATLVADL
jgi:putative cell wall-binding protein